MPTTSQGETLKFPVAFGDEVKDRITGFTGIVISLTEWYNACQRAQVQPPIDKDGKLSPPESFDVEQLKVITVAKVERVRRRPVVAQDGSATRTSGGPMPDTALPRMPTER